MKLALKFEIVEALRDNLDATFRRFIIRLHSGEKGMRILNSTLIASVDFPAKPRAAA